LLQQAFNFYEPCYQGIVPSVVDADRRWHGFKSSLDALDLLLVGPGGTEVWRTYKARFTTPVTWFYDGHDMASFSGGKERTFRFLANAHRGGRFFSTGGAGGTTMAFLLM
jgi:hypothetical protein